MQIAITRDNQTAKLVNVLQQDTETIMLWMFVRRDGKCVGQPWRTNNEGKVSDLMTHPLDIVRFIE